MPFKSKVQHKVISAQSREIISSVHRFMQEESDRGTFCIDLRKVQERVAAATKVSVKTIRKISKEWQQIQDGEKACFTTPNEKRVVKPRVRLDDASRELLRKTITDLLAKKKKTPTLQQIYDKFKKDVGYSGGRESMRREVHSLGFRWCKTQTFVNSKAKGDNFLASRVRLVNVAEDGL